MSTESGYSDLNEIKSDFSEIYTEKDPREYFMVLGQLDYIVPHVAQPVFDQLIRARAKTQKEPVTVLDLGCSYGLNGALMKYALRYDALRERYNDPALKTMPSEALLELDRHYYQAWPKNSQVKVIGLDPSENAVRYGEAVGTMDLGLALDLENTDPTPEQAKALESVDLIVSTGCVGYVTSKSFQRLTKLARRGRPAWVASFVLRMFSYKEIEGTLSTLGLKTEKFESATFVQLSCAVVISNRKWMPPCTRLSAASSASCANPAYVRVTFSLPPVPVHVTENGMASVPITRASARAALRPMHVRLLACDGYGGVASSGVQVGSGVVAGFSSSPARRMG